MSTAAPGHELAVKLTMIETAMSPAPSLFVRRLKFYGYSVVPTLPTPRMLLFGGPHWRDDVSYSHTWKAMLTAAEKE